MVEESPAAGRLIQNARKHSPWTCDRTRKKNKAHRGSPECADALAEAVEEGDEESEDHEMTEQEAHVLASLNQLGLMGTHGEVDDSSLPRSGSAPDGRRKVRGTRAQQSSGFHSRLRLCALNAEGSPVTASSKSCALGNWDQENTAPVFFLGVEQAKCRLDSRSPPAPPSATDAGPAPPQRASGVIPASHVRLPANAADQSLTTAAALASASRPAQDASQSPAVKGHARRRSVGGVHLDVLTDSAEALHGHGNATCLLAPGKGSPSPVPSQERNNCSSSPSSLASLGGSLHHLLPTPDSGSSQLTSTSSLQDGSVAKYGIAAFGVPAAVQSCFSGPTSASALALEVGCIAASVPGARNVPSRGHSSRYQGNSASATCPMGTFGGISHDTLTGAFLGRAVNAEAAGGASASAKALVDSAEEIELRRLTQQQQPRATNAPRPSASDAHGPFAFGTAAPAAVAPWTAPSAPPAASNSAAFDLAALAQSAGSVLFGTGHPASTAGASASVDAAGLSLFQAANNIRASAPVTDKEKDKGLALLQGPQLHSHHHHFNHQLHTSDGCTQVQPGRSDAHPHLDGSLNGAATASAPAHSPEGTPAPRADHGHTLQGHGHLPSGPGGAESREGRPGADVRTCGRRNDGGEGAGGGCDDGDDEDLDWLRTSQQTPDPDDPSSAGKFSAGLMRRVQDANANEELYGGIYGLYQSHETSGSGPSYGYGYAYRNTPTSSIKTGGSMEPSPMPRLSSRLRRLRASPYTAGSSGGRGRAPSISPTPSSLGTRCRSAGVTPGNGGGTGRRLRRRSDLVIDPMGHGLGCHGGADAGNSDVDLNGSPDQLVLDDGQRRHRSRDQVHPGAPHSSTPSSSQPMQLAGGPDPDRAHPSHWHQPQQHQRVAMHASLQWPRADAPSQQEVMPGAASLHGACFPSSQLFGPGAAAGAGAGALAGGAGGLAHGHHGSTHHRRGILSSSLSQPVLHVGGADGSSRLGHRAGAPGPQQRSQSHTGEACFFSGLMDYEDEGVEYSTPPHTPLRGVGCHQEHDHDQEIATAPRGPTGGALDAPEAAAGDAAAPAAAAGALFGPARGCAGYGQGAGRCDANVNAPPRVAFMQQRLEAASETPHLPPGASGSRWQSQDGRSAGSALQWLAAEAEGTVEEFNKWLGWAASKNDRGTAERLWHEMCSRGVAPDITTLNTLLRCLSRSAADPDDAQQLVCDVCSRGGFSPNSTSQRLLEEICFRFEQLAGHI